MIALDPGGKEKTCCLDGSGPSKMRLIPRHTSLRSKHRMLSLIAVMVLLASACGGNLDDPRWVNTDAPNAVVGPDIVAAEDRLVMALAATDDAIYTSRSFGPGSWSGWQPIGSEEGVDFASDTPPVLIDEGDEVLVLARSDDGNVYLANVEDGPAARWSLIVDDGSIGASFAAVRNGDEIHVAYPVGDGCTVATFQGSRRTASSTIDDCLEVKMLRDGTDKFVVAARSENAIRIMTGERGEAWAMRELEVVFRTTHALSEIARLDDSYHVVASQERLLDDVVGDTEHVLLHIGVPVEGRSIHLQVIDRYEPSEDGGHALAAITEYRGRLLALWTSPQGDVHAARWDVADSDRPWIVYRRLARGHGRPQLAARDYWSGTPDQVKQLEAFGDDAFAAVLRDTGNEIGDHGTTASGLILSRALMQRDIRDNLRLHDAGANECWDGGDDCTPDDPPALPALSRENRPVFTEVGFALWMFPDEFVDGIYPSFVRWFCETERWNQDRGGCVEPYRLAVFLKLRGGLFNWRGAWINTSSDYLGVWEEAGHYLAPALGFGTTVTPETTASERSGIQLGVLRAGRDIFAQEKWSSCKAVRPRCPGFTGHAGNYDTTGVEHSFIYAVYYYISKPELMREFIAADLAAGDDLLQRKYNWIKNNIFKGVEF